MAREELAGSQQCEEGLLRGVRWSRKWMQGDCGGRIRALLMGLYAPVLDHWLEYFGPHQFIVIASNSLQDRPQEVVKEVADAMGIPTKRVTSTKRASNEHNQGDDRNGKEITLPDDVLREVKRFFRPHVIRLKLLLGHRLALVGRLAWLSDPAYGAGHA